MKTSSTLAALALVVAISLRGQSNATAPDPLTFDVASVKVSVAGCPPACGLIRSTVGSAGYHAEGATLHSLMAVGYELTERRISGGPHWIEKERFDVEAKSDRPHAIDELHTMLAHLLEERFHLQVRRETRQESVWNLTVAQGGSKLPPHDPNDKNYPPIITGLLADNDGSVCGYVRGPNESMEYFALSLSRNLNITVIDQTGLPGRYDVNLRFMPEDAHPQNPGGKPRFLSARSAPISSPPCPGSWV